MISLKADIRDVKTSVSNTRAEGKIPAVVYGPKFANTNIALDYQDFIRTYNKHGETTLIGLEIDGKVVPALIHDFQLHPVTSKVAHIDFYVPEAGKKVHANVPVEFINESAAVKAGAQLVKVLHDIEVESLPESLPRFVEADLSLLTEPHTSIHVKDIKFPNGVKPLTDGEEVVASAVEYKEEKEAEAVDLGSIEVEKKGKKEEEGTESE